MYTKKSNYALGKITFDALEYECLFDFVRNDGCVTRSSAISQCNAIGKKHSVWEFFMTELQRKLQLVNDNDYRVMVLRFATACCVNDLLDPEIDLTDPQHKKAQPTNLELALQEASRYSRMSPSDYRDEVVFSLANSPEMAEKCPHYDNLCAWEDALEIERLRRLTYAQKVKHAAAE